MEVGLQAGLVPREYFQVGIDRFVEERDQALVLAARVERVSQPGAATVGVTGVAAAVAGHAQEGEEGGLQGAELGGEDVGDHQPTVEVVAGVERLQIPHVLGLVHATRNVQRCHCIINGM